MTTDDPSRAFYFNVKTKQVEEGPVSDWVERIGPYPTREAAEEALVTAQRRNAQGDQADEIWRLAWDDDADEDTW